MSSGRPGDPETRPGAGRWRLTAAAAVACVALTVLAMSPDLVQRRNIVEQGDVYHVYWETALKVRAGEVPYRDFPLEYPPLTLAVILPPVILGKARLVYEALFVLEMLLINAALIGLVVREVEREEGPGPLVRRLAWYCVFFTPLSRLAVSRVDLAPTLLAFWSAALWFRGRTGAGGTLAGLGALMKIFPGFVVFPGVPWEAVTSGWRRYRGLSAFVLVMTVGAAAWWWVGGQGSAASLRYHSERGLEIEAVFAGLLAGVSPLTGWRYAVGYDHGSFNLSGPGCDLLSRVSGLVQLAALLVTLVQFARRGYRSGLRFTLAVLLATVPTAKVLSPQYYLWFLPFVVTLAGPVGTRARVLYAVICALTVVVCPCVFEALKELRPYAIFVLNLRNFLTLALWWVVTFGPEPTPAASRTDPAAAT